MVFKRYGFVCALAALSLTAVVALSGCSASATGGSSEAASEAAVVAPDSESLSGLVMAIDGNTLTLATGMGGQDGPGEQGGQRPDGEMPDGQTPPDGEAPGSMPEGGGPNGERPADQGDRSGTPPEKPEGGAGMPDGMEPQTTTVTMAANVEVLLEADGQTTTGAAADITVGSVVKLELKDGVAVRVTLRQ